MSEQRTPGKCPNHPEGGKRHEFIFCHCDLEAERKRIRELEEENEKLEEQLFLYREQLRKDTAHADAHSLLMECYRGGIIDMVWLEMLVGKKFKQITALTELLRSVLEAWEKDNSAFDKIGLLNKIRATIGGKE